MIASWIVYCVLVALCLGVAASAAEHLIRLYGKPARGVWLVALVGSLLVPIVNWIVVNRVDASADGSQAVLLSPVVATSLLNLPIQFTLIGGPDEKAPEPPEGGVGLVGVERN
jgi:bla regulator protein BlaR1